MKLFYLVFTAGLLLGQASAGILDQLTESVKELPYSVVEKTEDYELRQYQTEKFVCTSMYDIDPTQDPMNGWQDKYYNAFLAMMFGPWKKQPSSKMFMKLFNYISGRGNTGETEVSMTAPVPMIHKPNAEGIEKQTMCFWLGTEYRDKEAPAPTSSDVTIFTMPAFEVYVTRFSGYALSDEDNRNPYNELKAKLLAAGKQIKQDSWMACGYDAPFKPFNRRNEVWIEKA